MNKLKTIAEEWEGFAASVLPKDASRVQRDEMRMAFFAGAWSIVCQLKRIGEPDITDDQGVSQFEALEAECRQFKAEYMARYSERN